MGKASNKKRKTDKGNAKVASKATSNTQTKKGETSGDNSSNNNAMKIIVPALILVVLIGIWFFKNNGNQPPVTADNSDFALHVTEEIDLDKLKSYGIPIMIDFGADDCAPCKMMAPIMVKLNDELRGKVIILFADVWKNRHLAQGYPIRVIPTQFFFDKDGNPYAPSENLSANIHRKINMHYSDDNEHIFTTHEGGLDEAAILEVLREMGLEE